MTQPEPGGWRASVQHDYLSMGVTMLLAQRTGDGYLYVTQIGGVEGFGRYDTEHVEQNTNPSDAVNLCIPEDAARALYDALAQHFAGEAGTRQTRADLVEERKRSDKLIGALIAVATGSGALAPMRHAILTLIAAGLLLTGCQPATGVGSSTGTLNATVTANCHARTENGQTLPDPTCTPGATNPAVTQADIGTTICKRGWTATVRPPVSYTDYIKRQSIAAYGLPAGTRGELDHLVPLELGGAPRDVHNLWIEPGPIPNRKDDVEGVLNRAACSGRISLAAAQQAIASDWTTAEQRLGIS